MSTLALTHRCRFLNAENSPLSSKFVHLLVQSVYRLSPCTIIQQQVDQTTTFNPWPITPQLRISSTEMTKKKKCKKKHN